MPRAKANVFMTTACAWVLGGWLARGGARGSQRVQVQGQAVLDPLTGQSLSREELLERLAPYQRREGVLGDEEPPPRLVLAGGDAA